jgi:hypothetical protein
MLVGNTANETARQAAEKPENEGLKNTTLETELKSIHREIGDFRKEARRRNRIQFGFVLLALGIALISLSFNYEELNQLGLLLLGLVLFFGGPIYLYWGFSELKT